MAVVFCRHWCGHCIYSGQTFRQMKTLQFIVDNKSALWAIAMTLHAVIVHTFIMVARAGGYRKLWREFQGQYPISAELNKVGNIKNSAPVATVSHPVAEVMNEKQS